MRSREIDNWKGIIMNRSCVVVIIRISELTSFSFDGTTIQKSRVVQF